MSGPGRGGDGPAATPVRAGCGPPLGPALEVRHLGRVEYRAARELQRALLDRRVADELSDQLLVLEHPEVVTLGRRTPPGAAEGLDLPVVEIERGGDATWHGPGQLVLYPIVALPEGRRDLHRYLRDLEQVAIDTLAAIGVVGERRPGLTGVWAGGRKLCSIGVALRRWVTWHGLALNVTNDLTDFERFRPCGLEPGVMGRAADLGPVPADDPLLAGAAERAFRRVFGYPDRA